MGLKRWLLKLVKHLADTTCILPSTAGAYNNRNGPERTGMYRNGPPEDQNRNGHQN